MKKNQFLILDLLIMKIEMMHEIENENFTMRDNSHYQNIN
jgi:hypothetical protein